MSHRRLSPFFAAAFLVLACCASVLRAQESWSFVTAPTTQNLWGVAYGAEPNLFVAVGDGGVLLTSRDGQAWTQRSVPTNAWLTSVTYSSGRYVVTGDAGTLLTSPDGLVWTSRTSGTTERLNAAAYAEGRWFVVGEHGARITSGDDGVTWSVPNISPQLSDSAPTGWLRGLTAGYGLFVMGGEHGLDVILTGSRHVRPFPIQASVPNGIEGIAYARRRFVAVGADNTVATSVDGATWRTSYVGRRLHAVTFFNRHFVGGADDGTIYTSPDTGAWTTISFGNRAPLLALAGSEHTLVAVGFSGTIVRSEAATSAPAVVRLSADLTEAAGANVLLSAVVTGSGPLTLQWSRDGSPLAGATTEWLALTAITAADAGRYTMEARGPLGTAISTGTVLTVVPALAEPASPMDPAFVPPIVGRAAPSALAVLPDGRIVTATSAFVHTIARLTTTGAADSTFTATYVPGTVAMLVRQPDGKILAGGASGPTGFLVRLMPDGGFDPGFTTAASALGTAITSAVVQADGKIIIANNSPRAVRLNADGTVDTSFASPDFSSYLSSHGYTPGIALLASAPGGGIVLAATPTTFYPGYIQAVPDVLVARLAPSGALDATFSPRYTGTTTPWLLNVLPDGRILLGSEYRSGTFFGGWWKVQRLKADGADDLSFAPIGAGIPKYSGNARAVIDASGRIITAEGAQNYFWSLRIRRYDADGVIDTTLRHDLNTYGGFESLILALARLPDGRILLAQERGRLNRLVAANASRLNPLQPLDEPTANIRIVPGGEPLVLQPRVAGSQPIQVIEEVYDAAGSHAVSIPAPLSGSSLVRLEDVHSDASVIASLSSPAGALYCPFFLRVTPAAPAFTTPPPEILYWEPGRPIKVPYAVTGSGKLQYSWTYQGRLLSTGIITSHMVDPAAPSSLYPRDWYYAPTVTDGALQFGIFNDLGSVTCTITLIRDPRSRLSNISTRGFVGTGDQAVILGFVISGTSEKEVLIRGIGPALTPFGVTGVLADPQLTLHDAAGTPLDQNDNWVGTHESYTESNWPPTFALPEGSRDAIISRRLAPGKYTVRLSGVSDTTGIGLIEVYDQIHQTPRLSNLSTRVFVGRGAQTAISGVVVSGESPKKLLIRAAGPALASFGVSGALAHPLLTLRDAQGVAVATNDRWESVPNLADLHAASTATGAFPLASGSLDAALLVIVPPGSYTAQVAGTDGTSGIALVEVYEVP